MTKELKKSSDYPNASFRLTGLEPEIRRGPDESWSAATRRFCEYAVAARQQARNEIAGQFSVRELHAIHAALNGTFVEPAILPYLHSEVYEFLEDEPWDGVDAASLRDRLRALSTVARWVLAEAVATVGVKGRAQEWAAVGIVAEGI